VPEPELLESELELEAFELLESELELESFELLESELDFSEELASLFLELAPLDP
jgi:hypothetical protein